MGLDMNIMRVRKSHYKTDKVYDRSEVDGIILSAEDLEAPMYRQLVPYCQELQVRNQYYDMNKIRSDFELTDNSYIWHMSGDGSIGVCDDKFTEGRKHVDISAEQINAKYTVVRVEPCYVCKYDDVRYWRKAYDVQDWFYENLPEKVENTGYYILTEELLEKFNKAWPEDAVDVEAPDENSALFYWEWY